MVREISTKSTLMSKTNDQWEPFTSKTFRNIYRRIIYKLYVYTVNMISLDAAFLTKNLKKSNNCFKIPCFAYS